MLHHYFLLSGSVGISSELFNRGMQGVRAHGAGEEGRGGEKENRMIEVKDAPWVGLCKEDYEERCNPYSHWEEEADYKADEADRRWKEEEEEKQT